MLMRRVEQLTYLEDSKLNAVRWDKQVPESFDGPCVKMLTYCLTVLV